MLNTLKNQLIVSCQPVDNGPLDQPVIVAAFAQAAIAGGAAALRIEGVDNIRAVRAVTNVPIIGLVKRDLQDSPVRITPWITDVADIIDSGADIVAFDATERVRPYTVEALVRAIHQGGRLAMADCAAAEDGVLALNCGCDILGSTLSGYTSASVPRDPDLALVTELSRLGAFTIAEGRYHSPEQAQQAVKAGADAIVVGSAITRPEHVTQWFAEAIKSVTVSELPAS